MLPQQWLTAADDSVATVTVVVSLVCGLFAARVASTAACAVPAATGLGLIVHSNRCWCQRMDLSGLHLRGAGLCANGFVSPSPSATATLPANAALIASLACWSTSAFAVGGVLCFLKAHAPSSRCRQVARQSSAHGVAAATELASHLGKSHFPATVFDVPVAFAATPFPTRLSQIPRNVDRFHRLANKNLDPNHCTRRANVPDKHNGDARSKSLI